MPEDFIVEQNQSDKQALELERRAKVIDKFRDGGSLFAIVQEVYGLQDRYAIKIKVERLKQEPAFINYVKEIIHKNRLTVGNILTEIYLQYLEEPSGKEKKGYLELMAKCLGMTTENLTINKDVPVTGAEFLKIIQQNRKFLPKELNVEMEESSGASNT